MYREAKRSVGTAATVVRLKSAWDVPEEVEAEDGDPGEGGHVEEVANVAGDRARVFRQKLAESVHCGAVEVEILRTREMGEKQESKEERGEDDIDKNNLAFDILVTWDHHVDEES